MKKLLILLTLLTSCGTSIGFIRDSRTSQNFQYSLDLKAVKMQRTVEASTYGKTILCVIPTGGKPAYAETMQKLHKEAKLKPNEVLVNIREDKQILTYLIYCRQRLTISADVYLLSHADAEPASSNQVNKTQPICGEEYWQCVRDCSSPDCKARCKKTVCK
jgi:hypothetical protein